MRTQTGGGLLYWPFLDPLWDSIFRALSPCFLDEEFSTEVRCGLLTSTLPALASRSPNLLTARISSDCRMTVTHRGYLCIYYFITLSVPVVIHGICFRLSTHASCLPVYTAGRSCPRNPRLTVLPKVSLQ